MSFKITVINNDNGKVLINEENAKALIGALVEGDNTGIIALTACNANDILNALHGCDEARNQILEQNHLIKALYDLTQMNHDD